MFSSISRYRKLPDVVTRDADGRATASRTLRLLPRVRGRFLHTVQAVDRLDHLAHRYYGQPRDWWRILDANPEFLSPHALLGTERLITAHVPLAWEGPVPPWSGLLRELRGTPGVQAAGLGTREQPYPASAVVDGPLAFAIAPALTADLDASTRTQVLAPGLGAALLAEGLALSGDLRLAKIDALTWRITDLEDARVLTVRYFPSAPALNVYHSAFRFEWTATVIYHRDALATQDLLSAIEARGFSAGAATEVHRVGKPIVIPPRVA